MATKYPDEKRVGSFEEGLKYQEFIKRHLFLRIDYYISKEEQYRIGESVQGIEVKYDSWISKSNRLSIEVAEKTRASQADWIPSGIYRPDNTALYVQGDYHQFFVFHKSVLCNLHTATTPYPSHHNPRRYEEHETPTIRAFYLLLKDAHRHSLYHIRI